MIVWSTRVQTALLVWMVSTRFHVLVCLGILAKCVKRVSDDLSDYAIMSTTLFAQSVIDILNGLHSLCLLLFSSPLGDQLVM